MAIGIVKLSGGLGNQMFQYAFYLRLKEEDIFDNVKIDGDGGFGAIPDHFGLDIFRVFKLSGDAQFANKKELKFFNSMRMRILNKLSKRFTFVKSHVVLNLDSKYNPTVFNRQTDTYFNGYWASFKYFPSNDIIHDTFNFEKLYQQEFNKYDMLIHSLSQKNTIGIHVRGADYITDSNAYKLLGSVLTPQYYSNAIDFIRRKVPNARFYLFTDDIEYSEKMLRTNYNRIDFAYSPVERENYFFDMYFLSKCQHNIIGNSTFAWWSAWLNKNPNKIVCYPFKWINGIKTNMKDFIPENYTEIEF